MKNKNLDLPTLALPFRTLSKVEPGTALPPGASSPISKLRRKNSSNSPITTWQRWAKATFPSSRNPKWLIYTAIGSSTRRKMCSKPSTPLNRCSSFATKWESTPSAVSSLPPRFRRFLWRCKSRTFVATWWAGRSKAGGRRETLSYSFMHSTKKVNFVQWSDLESSPWY